MAKTPILETLVGLFVIAVAAIFFFYAYDVSGKSAGRGQYKIDAVFGRVDGISVGSDVRIAGVKVGSVSANSLNTQTYEADLELAIDGSVQIPEDSVAKIVSDGLIGGAHVAIEPGGAEEVLLPGDKITITQGSVDLLGLAVQTFTRPSGGADDGATSEGQSENDPLGEF